MQTSGFLKILEQINCIISSKLKKYQRLVAVGVGLSGGDCGKPIKIPYIICYSIINKEEILVVLNLSLNNPLSLLHIDFQRCAKRPPWRCQVDPTCAAKPQSLGSYQLLRNNTLQVLIRDPYTSVLGLVQLHFIFNNLNDWIDGPLIIFTGNAQD